MTTTTKPRFEAGRILITPGARERLDDETLGRALDRHLSGDWGDCCEEDRKENDFSVDRRLRLLSVYHDRKGTRFWVITEADRSATTVLLPEEY